MVLVKNCLQKLKTIFAFRNYYGKCHLFIIFIVTLIYSISKEQYLILLIDLLLLIISFNHKSIFIIFLIILSITISTLLIKNYSYNLLKEGNINTFGKVHNVLEYSDYQKVILKINNGYVYFNSNDKKYTPGDLVKIHGSIKQGDLSHTPNGFNYKEHLKYNNIFGKFIPKEVEIIGKSFSIYLFHFKINQYIINNFDNSYNGILSALVIGNKNFMSEEIRNEINNNGISHLFVISGLHMEMISLTLFLILKLLKVKEKIRPYLVLIVLIIYFIITAFMVSILRVIIGFIISNLLSKQMKGFTPIDKFSINAGIVLLINPYYLFSYSFLLSYIIVLGIILLKPYLKTQKGLKTYLFNNILISTNSMLISLPIITSISNNVNLLSIIFNIIFIPFVTYLVLPMSFLTILIPPIKYFYKILISLFLFLNNFCSKIDILNLSFSHYSFFLFIIYYIIFYLLIKKRILKKKLKIISIYLLLLIYLVYQPYISIKNEIHFLDLPNGDAVAIIKHHQLQNILIDTGDVDATELVSFLKRKGIKKIDHIFISHGDSDHIGGIKSLINEFKIKKIYISAYDEVSINYFKKYKFKNTLVIPLKQGDTIKIDEYTFNVLWPNNGNNSVNNNSLVLLANINHLTSLFTGDIEKEVESKLISMYPNLKIDILKVPHHGSNTSSSEIFLNNIEFKIAVAMNGYGNKFNFPSSYVVKRYQSLDNVIMYNTKEYGTISLYQYFWQDKYQITTSFK